MTVREYAEQELKPFSNNEKDTMYKNVMELIDVFDKQQHEGNEASYLIKAFGRLVAYKPLSPLMGTEDEWVRVDKGLWQNKRCGQIFKEADGKCYDSVAKVFSEDGINWVVHKESNVEITFPYYVPDNPEMVLIDSLEELTKSQ